MHRSKFVSNVSLGVLAAVFGSLVVGLWSPVVTSGTSMAPTYGTSELLITLPTKSDQLTAGDVAVVRFPDGRDIAHRVSSVTVTDDGTELVTRGDNNAAADTPVIADDARRVVAHMPVWLGWAALLTLVALTAVGGPRRHRSVRFAR